MQRSLEAYTWFSLQLSLRIYNVQVQVGSRGTAVPVRTSHSVERQDVSRQFPNGVMICVISLELDKKRKWNCRVSRAFSSGEAEEGLLLFIVQWSTVSSLCHPSCPMPHVLMVTDDFLLKPGQVWWCLALPSTWTEDLRALLIQLSMIGSSWPDSITQ